MVVVSVLRSEELEGGSTLLRDRPADGQLPVVLAGATQGAQHAARIALTGSLDGMGHTYPDDFSEVIGRTVGFLTGQ